MWAGKDNRHQEGSGATAFIKNGTSVKSIVADFPMIKGAAIFLLAHSLLQMYFFNQKIKL